MKVDVTHLCKGCETPNKLVIKKPSYFTPTPLKIKCTGCESRMILFFFKEKGLARTQVKIDTEFLEISDKLKEIIVAKEKAKKEAQV